MNRTPVAIGICVSAIAWASSDPPPPPQGTPDPPRCTSESSAVVNEEDPEFRRAFQQAFMELEALEAAAESGDALAQFRLAERYRSAKLTDLAIEWYKRAAEHGEAWAFLRLASIYHTGEGIPKDTAEAIKWYTQATQHEELAAMPMYLLGRIYESGDGVPAQIDEAVAWYMRGAELGDGTIWEALAKTALGAIYFKHGANSGVSRADAIKWLTDAAEGGHVEGQWLLGFMHAIYAGSGKVSADAVLWLTRAAEQGSDKAQRALVGLSMGGIGVPKDAGVVIEWTTRLAEQGDVDSQRSLGRIFYSGLSPTIPYEPAAGLQNIGEAVKWYTRAAEAGDADAQLELSEMYSDGKGVPQDYVRAYLWASLAAAAFDRQGPPPAVRDLLSDSPEFPAVAQQFAQARSAFADIARQRRDWLSARMTREQVAEGQQLAAAFRTRVWRKTDEPPQAADAVVARASGSGFFITSDGYFVTNHHVVANAARVRVQTATGTYAAAIVRADPTNDLALLKVDGTFPALHVRGSTGVRLADRVFTVGYPNPRLQGLAPKFSSGEVAAITGPADDPRFFQISVPLQPGNSGGPLVDKQGSVVGVVIGQLDKAKALRVTGHLPENVSYAVKGTLLLTLLESVADLAGRLQPPASAGPDLADIPATVEKATGIVLVDR